jgi:hypothetical protein
MAKEMIADDWLAESYQQLARKVIELIERQRWIPVSERLPDIDDLVLVWKRERDASNPDMPYYDMPWRDPEYALVRGWWVIENSDTPIGLERRSKNNEQFGFKNDPSKLGAEALSWMPLPEPPTPEQP